MVLWMLSKFGKRLERTESKGQINRSYEKGASHAVISERLLCSPVSIRRLQRQNFIHDRVLCVGACKAESLRSTSLTIRYVKHWLYYATFCSCIDPALPNETETHSNGLNLHDCMQVVAIKESRKHPLVSATQPVAKREKLSSIRYDYLFRTSQMGFDSLPSFAFPQSPPSSFGTILDWSSSGAAPISRPEFYRGLSASYQHLPALTSGHTTSSNSNALTDVALGGFYSQTIVTRDVGDIHPAEFIAICRIEGKTYVHSLNIANK